jgi:tetratricopeptide (TPR) repeat protein
MDGRKSALLLLGLALASSGCVTTTEKKVTVRREDEAPPSQLPAAPEDPKKPVPPNLIFAYAQMKESEAEADQLKGSPEKQAHVRDQARLAYQELLRIEPESVAAYRGLARVYARLNDYDRARDTYLKALAKQPRDVNLWYDLGMMHNCKKEWSEGVRCFRKALEIDTEHQESVKALGFTLARMGQFDQSVIYLGRAMGSAAAAHFYVAKMLLHLSQQDPAARPAREELARQHLRQALQDNPQYENARELLASLDAPPVEIHFAEPRH